MHLLIYFLVPSKEYIKLGWQTIILFSDSRKKFRAYMHMILEYNFLTTKAHHIVAKISFGTVGVPGHCDKSHLNWKIHVQDNVSNIGQVWLSKLKLE